MIHAILRCAICKTWAIFTKQRNNELRGHFDTSISLIFFLSFSSHTQKKDTVMLCRSPQRCNRQGVFPFPLHEMQTIYPAHKIVPIRSFSHNKRPSHVLDAIENHELASIDCNHRTMHIVKRCHCPGRWKPVASRAYIRWPCIPMAYTGICWANIGQSHVAATHESFCWIELKKKNRMINAFVVFWGRTCFGNGQFRQFTIWAICFNVQMNNYLLIVWNTDNSIFSGNKKGSIYVIGAALQFA